MTASAPRQMFLNLPVSNLKRSITFFTELDFKFNAQFTDETTTCMIVNEYAYVMLLVESRFKDFTNNTICDTKVATEALFSFSAASRADVDAIVHKAFANGGKPAKDPQDHGFMYGWSFYDLDGHHWEVFWMDPAAVQG